MEEVHLEIERVNRLMREILNTKSEYRTLASVGPCEKRVGFVDGIPEPLKCGTITNQQIRTHKANPWHYYCFSCREEWEKKEGAKK